ncbi:MULTISPECIES: zonular occludens toxin family protein [Methylomicrobium]|uniref:Zonula occludens toxin n=1 Tax=Methylomicrobium album BG8 TaxID=686340 RepID=H8GQK8_METAL|nr:MULTISPECIES: zonular occludens toxin domain-containing protein [Methylomicrobium]EIC29835.1 zonula occludens toxin [Methylomicrobium album BG8]
MATSIHHGPPGSYKSFTLVQRRVIDALKSGRVVITNIRGLTSIDRIRDQFESEDIKIPDSADLLFVNTEVDEGRRLMAGWFHWVPLRALVIIDEGQRIYPDRRDFKMETLDQRVVPLGFQVQDIEIEISDDYTGNRYIVRRPEDVFTAFDMQRHFQWDVFISTTNIAKIKAPIREVAETAYRHKSLSGKLPKPLAKLFGFYQTWYEFQHDPENSGKLASNLIGKPRKYKADERIFRCYQSTATGEHTESKADQSILGDSKLKLLAAVLILALGSLVYNFATYAENHKKPGLQPASSAPASASSALPSPRSDSPLGRSDPVPSGLAADSHVHQRQNLDFSAELGFQVLSLSYRSAYDPSHDRLEFLAKTAEGDLYTLSMRELRALGFQVAVHGHCTLFLLRSDGVSRSVPCYPPADVRCRTFVDASDLVIRRDCRKRHEPDSSPPQNALVASASSLLDRKP